MLVNKTNILYTSIRPCRLPLAFTLFFYAKGFLVRVISVQCIVLDVVEVYYPLFIN